MGRITQNRNLHVAKRGSVPLKTSGEHCRNVFSDSHSESLVTFSERGKSCNQLQAGTAFRFFSYGYTNRATWNAIKNGSGTKYIPVLQLEKIIRFLHN